jgi:hypothetical protein
MGTEIKRREGFWKPDNHSYLPRPESSPFAWRGKANFLTKLEEVQTEAHVTRYKGYSTCRLCGCANGSGEYSIDGWVWPEGFKHYVDEHNVRPSLAFQEFILEELIE